MKNDNWYEELKEKYFPNRVRYDRTREEVEKELKREKYKNIMDWRTNSGGSYQWAKTQHWYSEIQDKYFPDRQRFDRTREEVEKELKKEKYKNIADWIRKNEKSFQWANKHIWYPEIKKKYFPNARRKDRTKEEIIEELKIKKYKNIKEWETTNYHSRRWAHKQSWYPEVRKIFFPNVKNKFINTIDRTRKDIEKELKRKKYKNIADWERNNQNSYSWSCKQPWYPLIKKKYFPDAIR
jgi:hypothetical protein